MNQFQKARTRLTLQYTLILFIICGTITGLYYARTSRIIDQQYQRIESRLSQGELPEHYNDRPRLIGNQNPRNEENKPGPNHEILKSELDFARKQIKIELIFINILVLILGATSSYFLSGKTLKPIKKSLESQQRFVADAAHELKTPITALKTSLEVSLMDTSFDSKTKHILKDNLFAVSSLESLTENLLTLAKAQDATSGPMSSVKIVDIISRATKHTQPLAAAKGSTISIKKYDTSITILGGEDSLVEVLIILLDNAIKFSPKKSKINISILNNKKTISLSVSDTGPGISDEQKEKIFERFYQADTARSKSNEGGYGLGLAVAKEIVEQHNGKISVTKNTKTGSIFTICIPC